MPAINTAVLEIPTEVLDSSRLTVDEIRLELAVHLYEQGRLSIGKAHELARRSLWEFRQILGGRGIHPHFDHEDLTRDLETLGQLED